MKFIEDKLEAMDTYFSTKKESEKWLIILGIAGLITYLAFTFLLPYTENMYKKSVRTRKAIEKRIKDNQIYLSSITRNGDRDYMVKQLTREIKQKKNEIVNYNTKLATLDKNIQKLSDMLFNQRSWSKFLDSITEKAAMHNVDIQYLNNKYVDHNGSFGHVLEINIGTKSDYKSIVKFMNELEQNTLVTDIYGTDLELDANSSDIMSDINVSVWGINH